jgi:DNA-binding CsgD family transcriptional regulator
MSERKIREGLEKLSKDQAVVLYWTLQGKSPDWIAGEILKKERKTYDYHMGEIYTYLGFTEKEHWTVKRERLIREVYPIFSEFVKTKDDLEKWQTIKYEYAKVKPPQEQSSIPEEPQIFIKDETPASGQKQQSQTQQPRQPTQRKTSWPLVLLGFGAGALISCIVIGVIFTAFFRNRSASLMPTFTEVPTSPAKLENVSTAEITDTPRIIINPTPTLPSNLLFYDNFDNGISPQWEQIVGTFASVNGRLSVIEGQPFLFRGKKLAVMKIGDNSWKRYIVEASMYPIYGSNSNCMGDGIGVSVVDLNNMLFFNLGADGNNWWEIIENSECKTIEKSYNYKNYDAKFLGVRLIVDNGKFTAFVNEIKSSEIIIENDKFKSGGVILVASEDSDWDNFLVYPIP